MEEKEVTKVSNFIVERYYQKEDFFIDVEYHNTKGKVIVYVGDKTDFRVGCVMKLASFESYPDTMRSEHLLNSIEKMLRFYLYQYNLFKKYFFQSEIERIEEDRDADLYGDYGNPHEYDGEWDYGIQKESKEELSVKRYKYGKYFFDFVRHNNSESDYFEIEVYMYKKGHCFKILCDKMLMKNHEEDFFYEAVSYRFPDYILAYKKPWEFRLLEPGLEKTFDKAY